MQSSSFIIGFTAKIDVPECMPFRLNSKKDETLKATKINSSLLIIWAIIFNPENQIREELNSENQIKYFINLYKFNLVFK